MLNFTVFIGRMQPVHNGHLAVIRKALQVSERLIILVGSANRARDIRNPWTYQERCEMINSCLTLSEKTRIFFAPLPDYMYQDNAWAENVQKIVYRVVDQVNAGTNPSISVIGNKKDKSGNDHMDMFPLWGQIEVANETKINATDIRDILFTDRPLPVENYMPTSVYNWISDWRHRSDAKNIVSAILGEYKDNILYKEQWKTKAEGGQVPYKVIFSTTDAVIMQSAHVLMVERGASPGKGLMALPGGFLEYDLTLLDNAIKEVYEETNLDIPRKVLLGSLKDKNTFDDPYRSVRGRTITHSFFFELEARPYLPKVKGGDDAKKAFWMPVAKLRPEDIFEDHWFQIQYFLNR